MGVNDQTEFLLARIAEEEANAEWIHDSSEDNLQMLEFFGACTCGRPARALADCQAKRRAIESAWGDHLRIESEWGRGQGSKQLTAANDYPEVVSALAEVYADHPDYRPEWRISWE